MELRSYTRVIFDEYIERVKDVVDAGDFLYLKRYGKFDAMPACWKHLDEHQRRDVATLIVFLMMIPRLIAQKNLGHFPISRSS